ncbi:hypothetical protein [Saccharibacillus sp. JS10]|uniref:hypothetical protein n=1 Tax=Saccharibacillus sp. JS10 TaxID=2950552 RepID=UPI00210CADB9|nr:hypothetical protein [Saccharibacillus sp. JS10]MCQ4085543.1 hypothetical protein [Saccharibacillus sp. JS10]
MNLNSVSARSKIMMLTILLSLLLILSSCQSVHTPPGLTATRLNGQEMSTPVLGSYSWQGTESDSEPPTMQVLHEDVHELPKKGGIRLKFEEEEPFQLSANLISMENPQAPAIPTRVDGKTVTLPNLSGYYALQIWSVWGNEDYASYSLSIQIK